MVDKDIARAYGLVFNQMVENGEIVADQLSKAFAALADPTRRDIVARLAIGDAGVNELAAPYEMSLQAVSKHLKVLQEAGLVSRSKDAQRRPVHLEAERLAELTSWIEHYHRLAEQRLSRLEQLLSQLAADGEVDPNAHQAPHAPQGDPS